MTSEPAWSEVYRIAAAPCPAVPGIYKVFLADSDALSGTALAGLKPGSPLYVGKAERSLATRDLRQHLTSGGTGSSTLRRSLGAVLKEELALKAIPRNDGSTSKYRFDSDGEDRLTEWMLTSLTVSWLVCSNADDARAIEPGLIRSLKPVLNDNHNPDGEYRDVLRGLRAACRDEAKQQPHHLSGSAGPASRTGGRTVSKRNADAVNRFLQQHMAHNGIRGLDAVTAGALLDRAGILRDSAERPGQPLRRLLRRGAIQGGYQDASRRWHIPRLSWTGVAPGARRRAMRLEK